jgi:hypothetical protein
LTDAKIPTQGGPLEFGIAFSDRGGRPEVNYIPSPELAPPSDYTDRIEWVRKSYERFIEKMLEIETLRGATLAF